MDGGNQFGFGSLTAVTLLTINVQRNTAAPFFTHFNSIQVTIDESAPIGTFIVDLNATDADTTVSDFNILNVNPFSAELFKVECSKSDDPIFML